MYTVKIGHKFIWGRMHELASVSPPYERVPNMSQYTFNNFFIIYLLHYSSSFIVIPPAYEVCHGGIMFLSFLCVCVCVSVNNFRVRSITLKPLNIFS